jgi:predicted DNA-binding transcriptional regulator AlpA
MMLLSGHGRDSIRFNFCTRSFMPKPKPHDDYLTISQAARLKKVSRSALYDAINQKRLASTTILGRVVVLRADLLAWTPRRGRPPGPLSDQHKARLSQALKRRWAERKKQD